MADIQGILFDLGDTLLDFGSVDTIDLFEQGAHLSYDYLKSLHQPLPAFHIYHRRQLWAIRWAYFKSRLIRREFNSLEILGRISQTMGQNLSQEQFEQLAWFWYEPLSRQARVEKDLPSVLRNFRDRGIKLGIMSNTFIPGPVLDRHLRQEGLLEYFPVRIYSCDVQYRKPDPRIFGLALQQLNLRANQLAFVGDSLSADIAGANRAGMVTILKDPSGKKSHPRIKPARVIRNFSELPAAIAQ